MLLVVVLDLSGGQVEDHIVAKRVQCPKVADGFEIHRAALTLIKSDRRAQRALYDVSKFAARSPKGFGPPVTEVAWYWSVAKMAEAPTVKGLRSMSGVVKQANLGVEQHGVGLPLGQGTFRIGRGGSNEWNDSVGCKTIENELNALSKH